MGPQGRRVGCGLLASAGRWPLARAAGHVRSCASLDFDWLAGCTKDGPIRRSTDWKLGILPAPPHSLSVRADGCRVGLGTSGVRASFCGRLPATTRRCTAAVHPVAGLARCRWLCSHASRHARRCTAGPRRTAVVVANGFSPECCGLVFDRCCDLGTHCTSPRLPSPLVAGGHHLLPSGGNGWHTSRSERLAAVGLLRATYDGARADFSGCFDLALRRPALDGLSIAAVVHCRRSV